MSMKKSETLDIREVDTRKEFLNTLKEKWMILLLFSIFLVAWVLIIVFYIIDLNTFLMIISSILFSGAMILLWIRTETRLSMTLYYLDKVRKEEQE